MQKMRPCLKDMLQLRDWLAQPFKSYESASATGQKNKVFFYFLKNELIFFNRSFLK